MVVSEEARLWVREPRGAGDGAGSGVDIVVTSVPDRFSMEKYSIASLTGILGQGSVVAIALHLDALAAPCKTSARMTLGSALSRGNKRCFLNRSTRGRIVHT